MNLGKLRISKNSSDVIIPRNTPNIKLISQLIKAVVNVSINLFIDIKIIPLSKEGLNAEDINLRNKSIPPKWKFVIKLIIIGIKNIDGIKEIIVGYL